MCQRLTETVEEPVSS
jgi:hypothetical protein